VTEVVVRARVEAAPDAVWELICDLRRVPEWVEGTVAMTRLPEPVAAAGVTYSERTRVAGPVVIPTHWEITEFEPPRRQVHEGRGLIGNGTLVLEVEPDGDATTYSQTVRLRTVLGRLLERRLRSSLEANVDGLRRVLGEGSR
jgi:hypothetical protein